MNPLRLAVYLRPVNEPNPKPLSTTVHFFGGAAEAAGGYMCELPATETPATLGELIAHLGEENPALGRILEVSSFLVNERSARLDTELMPGVRVDVLPTFCRWVRVSSHLCGSARSFIKSWLIPCKIKVIISRSWRISCQQRLQQVLLTTPSTRAR